MDGGDGWPAAKVFAPPQALSLDEVMIMPASTAGTGKKDQPVSADLSTRLTKHLSLRTPLVGGPSRDTTEADMAIKLALLGGIGIIHRHQNVRSQVQIVTRVKQYEAGFVLDPPTMQSHQTVREAMALQAKHGGRAIMITSNGKMGGKLLGLATSSDLECAPNPTTTVNAVMAAMAEPPHFVCMVEPVTLPQVRKTMKELKVSYVPVINEDRELVAVVCRSDMKRNPQYPLASRDANKRLLVAASVAGETEDDFERAVALLEGGADVLVMDTEDVVTKECLEFIKRIKAELPGTDLLAGPVSSPGQARMLLDAGADGLRVGHRHPGQAGRHGEASVLYEIANYARNTYATPILFDGGACGVGQIIKALCLGAHTVCIDAILEALDEAPGDHMHQDGVRMKLAPCPDPVLAEQGRKKKNEPVFPIIALRGVPMDRGSIESVAPILVSGLQQGLADVGLRGILAVGQALASGTLRFERVLQPSLHESDMVQPVRIVSSTLHNRW